MIEFNMSYFNNYIPITFQNVIDKTTALINYQ